MTPPVRRVLVVGGGTAGSVLSLGLRQSGVDVVLAEKQTQWRAIGHGITIQGNALRALREVGVADEVVAAGAPFDRLRIRTTDGTLIRELVSPPVGGEDLPATMGSMRFLLQQILSRHVHASGTDVRLGTTVTALDDDGSDDGVTATFSDGTTDRFDLVVGADGVHSTIRTMIGIDVAPQPIGIAIWRMQGPRQPGMDCAEIYYGGPRYKLGFSPISPDHMYAYVMDEDRRLDFYGDRPAHEVLAERAADYGGFWPAIRAGLSPDTPIDYRSLEALLIQGPWFRGRVLLIGDAAHACPPTLAQGAAQAAEDAVVLAEIVGEGHGVDKVLDLFMDRRYERAAMVVNNSVQLSRWEKAPDTPGADPAGLMASSMSVLAGPF